MLGVNYFCFSSVILIAGEINGDLASNLSKVLIAVGGMISQSKHLHSFIHIYITTLVQESGTLK